MKFARKALEDLKEWSERSNHKPLIIRGARQVGKSTLVRMLSTQFDGFSELNFEDYSVRDIFGQRLDFPDILERVLLMGNEKAQEGRTLIFFDEI
ncbi:MAG: AAA family ATPase [Lewinella sp.]|nr:AAA family ATPase [Lewinella sp.]